jgi:hypothetical protein
VREEEIRSKEAPVANITGTQFEFSTNQLERDRQKMLDGPQLTGMSMLMAAKTTPSVWIKLKEAQEEISELRLAFAKQNTASL